MTSQHPTSPLHANAIGTSFTDLSPELAAEAAATLAVLNPSTTSAVAHELTRHVQPGGFSSTWAAANRLFELSLALRLAEADTIELWETMDDLDDLVDQATESGVLPFHLAVEFKFACLVIASEASGLQSGLSLIGDHDSPAKLIEALLAVLQVRATRLARLLNRGPLEPLRHCGLGDAWSR